MPKSLAAGFQGARRNTTLPRFALLLLVTLVASCSSQKPEPRSFTPPPGWAVSYKRSQSFYAIKAPDSSAGLPMFSPWPPPGRPEAFASLLEAMAGKFSETLKAENRKENPNTKLSISRAYQIEDLGGPSVAGKYIAFEVRSESKTFTQAIFFLNVNSEVWQGQFTGTPDNWTNALKSIETIRRSTAPEER